MGTKKERKRRKERKEKEKEKTDKSQATSAPVNYPAIQTGRKSFGAFLQPGKKLDNGQAGLIADDYLGRV